MGVRGVGLTMRIKFNMKGVEAMQKALKERKANVVEAVKAGVYVAAGNLMTESKRQVPVDEGVLRASGYVTAPTEVNGRIECTVGYGGAAAAYAAYQHEIPMNHPEGGKDHFLSDPMRDGEGTFRDAVTAFAARALQGDKVGVPAGAHPETPEGGG